MYVFMCMYVYVYVYVCVCVCMCMCMYMYAHKRIYTPNNPHLSQDVASSAELTAMDTTLPMKTVLLFRQLAVAAWQQQQAVTGHKGAREGVKRCVVEGGEEGWRGERRGGGVQCL